MDPNYEREWDPPELLCACLGRQFNEPECPCAMRRLGLPPSQERLDYLSYLDSPEGLVAQVDMWEKFRKSFEEMRDGQ